MNRPMSLAARSRPAFRPLRLIRWIMLAILAVLLLPYVLTLLYLVVPPVSTPMLWRWMTGQRVERTYVSIDAIPPSLPQTVMASEDARFCSHWGVDWKELKEAIEEADDLSEARGGSTLTQQVAKNLFLWQGRSFVRKALEFPLAHWIDFVLSKRRVMEIYLNIAEWGPDGQFGAEAGARHAFGKPASALTSREAALMAAILPNPLKRSAKRPGPGVRRLAGIYEGRGRRVGDGAACLQLGRKANR